MPRRLFLAHLPTPLVQPRRLAAALGIELWVKRDDVTGGAESGNKIRKLEMLLAAAEDAGADVVVTCGGLQSNHARATALLAASLGMKAVLVLRTSDAALLDGSAQAPAAGNVFLDRLAGAELRFITPEQYGERDAYMRDVAAELTARGRRPYVIPEGGSNGLGALGYVEAMAEVRRQLDIGIAGGETFDVVFHACGSGGTAAGIALGAARHDVAAEVRAIAVCDDRAYFEPRIDRIAQEASALDPRLIRSAHLVVDDRWKGPAYGVPSPEQRRCIVDVARLSGLVLDPVYTGKAFFALRSMAEAGELRGERVLFVHTGGLPGLLAQAADFEGELGS